MSVDGQVAWQDHVPVRTRWLDGGGAVQDAGEWWTIITDAVRKVLANGDVPADRVVAVCITGQWASTVPVDADGVPVGDCIMWQDHRGIRLARQRIGGPVAGYDPRALAAWVRKTAGIPGGNDPVGHMLNLATNYPEVAAAARWYLEPVDYLAMRFTGVPAATHASMTAAWLTDNRHLDLLAYDDDLVRRAGRRRRRSCRRSSPRARSSGRCAPTWPPTSACRPGCRWWPACPTSTPPPSAPAPSAPARRTWRSAPRRGSASPCRARRPTSCTAWPASRASTGATCWPTTTTRRACASSGCATTCVAPADGLFGDGHPAADPCTFDDLTALAAGSPPGARRTIFTPVARRASARRWPTATCEAGSTTSRWPPPAPTWSGP